MNMKTETVEAVGRTSQIVTQSAAAFTGWAWLTSNEFYGFVGALGVVLGFWVTLHYKRKANKRMEEAHAARMRREELVLTLMRATGRPFVIGAESDTDLGKLEELNV